MKDRNFPNNGKKKLNQDHIIKSWEIKKNIKYDYRFKTKYIYYINNVFALY